jgi:hypothetical protein
MTSTEEHLARGLARFFNIQTVYYAAATTCAVEGTLGTLKEIRHGHHPTVSDSN